MGLRCLIGHDFGAVRTDRDREERGDEVVVTVREYRECDRCGEVRVVSENTEVRHREAGAPAAESGAGEEPESAIEDEEAFEGDDGVILEDGEEAPREPGEWPESEAEEAAEDETDPAPWPDVEGEDEGYAAEPSDGGPADGVEFGSGLTPEATPTEPGDADGDADGGDVIESEPAGGGRAGGQPAATSRQRTIAGDAEFFCPECGFSTPTVDSSLRSGDICPNCRLGYLTEREG